MQIEQLSKRGIQEFSKALKVAGIESSVFEIFFDTVTGLIDPYKIDYTQDIQKILHDCKFQGMNEIDNFLKNYNTFTNSVVGFIDEMLLFEDLNQFDKKLSIVFKTLYSESQERDSYKILHTKIDQVLLKVIEVYEIDMVNNFDSIDKYIDYMSEIFEDKEVALQIAMLTSISVILKEQKIDENELDSYFLLVVSLVSVLNEFRKDEFQRVQDDKVFIPRSKQEEIKVIKAGRNDPCPCGSGKKYKKCCLNKKQEQKIDPLDELDTPIATHFPLTRAEIDAFYSLWSRLINFADNLLCDMREQKHKKLYFKDSERKYTLTEDAFKDNRYVDVRDFLLTNFDRIVDDFITSNRVSKENIDILQEWKRYRLYSDNFLIYESTQVGVVIYDAKTEQLYHLYDLYNRVYDLSKEDTMLSMLLLPYKGRIVFDGVIGQMGVEFGQNSKDMFFKNYITLRKKSKINTMLPKESSTTKIYQLKIGIKGAKPPIWRRILIEDDITYQGMHYIVQDIFEWENSHLFEFIAKTKRYTDLSIDDGFMEDIGEDANKFTIGDDLKEIGDKITYLYDFGDYWEHEIKLEDILEKEEHESYPKCIKGKGRGPFEDIGGIWAYNEIVQAYKVGDKKTLDDFYFSIEDGFNPAEFDIDEVNARLK